MPPGAAASPPCRRGPSPDPSALNAICDQQGLARTSKTPGRTQQLVVFPIDAAHRLIDLPGYGYAKVPANLRLHWRGLIDTYLRTRGALKGLVLIMDVGETIVRAGDIVIQRGTNHGWANRSDANCRIAFILIDGAFEDGLS